MESILVKLFAVALTLSQITTRPDELRTQFDPIGDRTEVVRLLQAGCMHMRKAFAIESIDVDGLIATAMNDPRAADEASKAIHGLNFDELLIAYRQFCRNETVARPAVDLSEVISFYNKALVDLPDHTTLKDRPLAGMALLLDQYDRRFGEIGKPEHRRIWVPLSDIPDHVQKAFVAAEDKRFFQHHGVDERGMGRAFVGNLARPGRMQGGSTITQQVAKNLLVGDDVSFDRKIREIVVASRLEQTLSKPEILALYLNSIYLGRGSWGIEMAARSYFGKHASELTLAEGAVLAGLTRGPSYYSPDRYPGRAHRRLDYVLNRLQEDGEISVEQKRQAAARLPGFVNYGGFGRGGFHFVDEVAREAKALAGIAELGGHPYTVRSTIAPELQQATEAALQEGLARYELRNRRQDFQGPEANLSEAVQRIEQARAPSDEDAAPQAGVPAWQQALMGARLPLYDVHWPVAVVLPPANAKGDRGLRVGLRDGRILPLANTKPSTARSLKPYDVIFVKTSGKGRSGTRAELRVRPVVQGAAVVLENKTGKILAMAGGFSYPLSQLNRATQSRRQPGSTLKPVTYLAALRAGLQPNATVLDEPITLPPPDGTNRPERYWTPRNDSGSTSGAITLRRALENSRNLATANLLDGGIAKNPRDSLDRVCELAIDLRLYSQCEPYYPFVLGAQPVRVVDMAAFFATIANEGQRPPPHTIESIELNGRTIYRHQDEAEPIRIKNVHPATFFQLRSMLEGVVSRGTARSIRGLARYVAGKTGTTTDVNDAWFVGFSNDVTVAVWVGYDNGGGQRRTLGDGETGNGVAVPIFEDIMQAAWRHIQPRTVLRPPSAEARRRLVERPVDPASGVRSGKRSGGFVEHLRLNQQGRLDDPRSAQASSGERRKANSSESRKANPSKARPGPSDTATNRTVTRRSAQPQQQQNGWSGGWGWGGPHNAGWTNRGWWNERD